MKYVILFLAAAGTIVSCDVKKRDSISDDAANERVRASMDSTTVFVIDTAHDFGKCTDGEKVEFRYRFINSGTKPLVINSTTASCGCTVPEKPELPILPHDTGYIKVVFNSKDRAGMAHKTIDVKSNAKPDFPLLLLTGEVVKE